MSTIRPAHKVLIALAFVACVGTYFGLPLWADPPAPAPNVPPVPVANTPLTDGRTISGPYSHDNLTVFLVHGPDKLAGRKYLTLQEALDQKIRGDELQRFILSYLLIHLVTKHRPGVLKILQGLHFPLSTRLVPEFGDLPMTRIEFEVSTERPSDSVVVQSAELSGMDAFEEVVKAEDISQLRDSTKERLTEIARQHLPQPT